MSQNDQDSQMVSLNEIAKILGSLNSRNIRSNLVSNLAVSDCTGVRCGCDGTDCGCRGSVTKIDDVISVESFFQSRNARLVKLQEELKKLESEEKIANAVLQNKS